MNLVVNARDAMTSEGRLVIGTKDVNLDDALLRAQETVTFDKYVMLTVADTGAGMTAEVRDRIFEPFSPPRNWGGGPAWDLPRSPGS